MIAASSIWPVPSVTRHYRQTRARMYGIQTDGSRIDLRMAPRLPSPSTRREICECSSSRSDHACFMSRMPEKGPRDEISKSRSSNPYASLRCSRCRIWPTRGRYMTSRGGKSHRRRELETRIGGSAVRAEQSREGLQKITRQKLQNCRRRLEELEKTRERTRRR